MTKQYICLLQKHKVCKNYNFYKILQNVKIQKYKIQKI